MKAFFKLFLFLITVSLTSCDFLKKEYTWNKTQDNLYLRCPVKDSSTVAYYKWDGGSFGDVINGDGTLVAFDKKGNQLWQKRINAYYGATDSCDIQKGTGFRYVGSYKAKETEEYNFRKTPIEYDGFGVYIDLNKDLTYIGDFKHSTECGKGKLFEGKRLQYEGNFKDNCPEGEGILYKEDGTERIGIFKNGKLYRSVEEIITESGVYKGIIVNNKRNGYGIQKRNDGSFYQGNWVNDSKSGEGYEWNPDGSSYKGEWENDKRNGKGKQIWSNGDYYDGGWLENEYNGRGLLQVTSQKASYYGYFKNGLQHGKGVYICEEYTYDGNWEDGWMNGIGTVTYSNGDKYEGEFIENEFFGIGKYTFATGNVYEGEFIDNQINGIGILQFKNGSFYQGEFENGKIKGDGTFYSKDDNGRLTALTAFWPGDNAFPNRGSLLFENGDLYQGELVNGRPTLNGVWYTQEERFGGAANQAVQNANEFYKKHQDEIEKYVGYTQLGLNVVSAVCVFAAPFTGGASLTIAAGARTINISITLANAITHISSDAESLYESLEYNEDCTENVKLLAKDILLQSINIAASISVGAPKTPKFDNRTATGITRKMNAELNKVAQWVKNNSKIINKYANEIFSHIGKLSNNPNYKTMISRVRVTFKQLLSNPDNFFNDEYHDIVINSYYNYKKGKALLANAVINGGWITIRENFKDYLKTKQERKEEAFNKLSQESKKITRDEEDSKIRFSNQKTGKTRGVGIRIVKCNEDKKQYLLDTLKAKDDELKEAFSSLTNIKR